MKNKYLNKNKPKRGLTFNLLIFNLTLSNQNILRPPVTIDSVVQT